MAVLFTSGQLMAALGLTKQQWRTYRGALPQLNKDAGRAACYAAGDLLATSVAKVVTEELGCPLSRLTPLSEGLFKLCSETAWPQLERSYFLLGISTKRIELVSEGMPPADLALCVALDPLIALLRKALLHTEPEPQRNLKFPLMVAGGKA